MFIDHLSSNPHFYVYVVVTMVLSVVMHELAHGWAAIWQGDRTPIDLGHMTIDPRVHMGALSLLMLVFCGICYGAMPVNPRRFRSRYGHAWVSLAGPLMNLMLALLALTGLAAWRLAAHAVTLQNTTNSNLQEFLWVFGYCNIALCVFNLIPIPPLDGSSILANLNKGYARLIERVRDPRVNMFALLVVITVISSDEVNIYRLGGWVAGHYLQWLYALAA